MPRLGTPGASDPHILAAHRQLARLEPRLTPNLQTIRVLADDLQGSCRNGTIFISPHRRMYLDAKRGDIWPLVTLLFHEAHHQRFSSDEATARAATVAFIERHAAHRLDLHEEFYDQEEDTMTTFIPRTHENGGICCSSQLDLCPKCIRHFARTASAPNQENNMQDDFTPPNSYEPHLAQLRAASATTSSTFAERFDSMRRREFAVQQAEIDANIASAPRLTAAEAADLASYAPPDPYSAGIKALQQKEAR